MVWQDQKQSNNIITFSSKEPEKCFLSNRLCLKIVSLGFGDAFAELFGIQTISFVSKSSFSMMIDQRGTFTRHSKKLHTLTQWGDQNGWPKPICKDNELFPHLFCQLRGCIQCFHCNLDTAPKSFWCFQPSQLFKKQRIHKWKLWKGKTMHIHTNII